MSYESWRMAYQSDEQAAKAAYAAWMATNAELRGVLDDWNAIVAAISAPSHGTAVGRAAAMRQELDTLRERMADARQEP